MHYYAVEETVVELRLGRAYVIDDDAFRGQGVREDVRVYGRLLYGTSTSSARGIYGDRYESLNRKWIEDICEGVHQRGGW